MGILFNEMTMADPRPESDGSRLTNLPDEGGPQDPHTAEVLEQAMRETLAGAPAISGPELQTLMELARDTGPVSLTEELAREINHRLVRTRLKLPPGSETEWRDMVHAITSAMWDDPTAQSRFVSLWANLRQQLERS
jgi:hypothetical protein